MKSHLLSLLAVLTFSVHTYSKDTESKSSADIKTQAMKDTQDILKDPAKIKELADKDDNTKAVDNHVKEIAGNDENTREMFSISADILPVLMEMNQDNPEKALESLAQYSKDPETFLKSLPANIRGRIEAVAKKIEKQKGAGTTKP